MCSNRWTWAMALAMTVLTACSGPSTTTIDGVAPDPPGPACDVTMAETGTIYVGLRSTGLTSWDPYMSTLRVWPFDDHSVLVSEQSLPNAWEGDMGHNPLNQTLWRVNCATASPSLMFSQPDANVGFAELVDETDFYFSGATGVSRLDLVTGDVEIITTTPPMSEGDCWAPEGGGRDLVIGRDGRTLVLSRGGTCGYEGEFEGYEVLLDLDNPERLERSYPVTSLASDASGALWMTTGASCDMGQNDPLSTSVIFQSVDQGETWRAIEIPPDEWGSPSGVPGVVFAGTQPGHAVVATRMCASSAGNMGGSVLVTRNGGDTWQRLAMPDEYYPLTAYGQGVRMLEVRDAHIDHLTIYTWGEEYYYQYTPGAPEYADRWETNDGGATWRRDGRAVPQLHVATDLTIGDVTLRPSRRGLWRGSRLVFPGAHYFDAAAEQLHQVVNQLDEYSVEQMLAPGAITVAWEDLNSSDSESFDDPLALVDALQERGWPGVGGVRECSDGCCEFEPLSGRAGGFSLTSACFTDLTATLRVTHLGLQARE